MAKRKRSRNTDERSGPPRKSARLAKNNVSTEGSSKNMLRFDDDDSHGRLDSGSNGGSGEKSLSSAALVKEVSKMVENENQAELMILELMREYSFNFSRLKELLRGKVIQPHLFDLHPTNYHYSK
jgi:hypothetical protein